MVRTTKQHPPHLSTFATALDTELACGHPVRTFSPAMPTSETLVRHARVIDGTGAAPFVSDVAIADGTIVRVGPELRLTAEHEIDGTGLCIAPGFIDVHTH